MTEQMIVTRGQNGRFTSVSSINRANSTGSVHSPFTVEDFKTARNSINLDDRTEANVHTLSTQLKTEMGRFVSTAQRHGLVKDVLTQKLVEAAFGAGVQLGIETAGGTDRIG